MGQIPENYSGETLEAIRRRATKIYLRTGAVEGNDAENFFQAEAEILRESATHPVRRAVIVNIEGGVYTGEYHCNSPDGYTPGEGKLRDSITIRPPRDKLYRR